MKKWMYLIFPGAFLGLFLIFFFSHKKESDEKERVRLEVAAKKKADDADAKSKAEEKAKVAAAQRQAEREKEEADKDRVRREKQEKIDRDIRDDTNKALAEADAHQKEINALELELSRLHKSKDAVTREAFDLQKAVELEHIKKRNAELEIQRFTEMIARRAAQSSMAQMPPPPPPPAAAK
jgi:preprotein translocase subunit SecF